MWPALLHTATINNTVICCYVGECCCGVCDVFELTIVGPVCLLDQISFKHAGCLQNAIMYALHVEHYMTVSLVSCMACSCSHPYSDC